MKKNNIFKILNWILFGAAVIISLAAYRYLPDKVALHIGITGELSNYVNKGIASIVAPAIVLFLNIYYLSDKENSGAKNFFISLVIIAAHVLLIFKNIK